MALQIAGPRVRIHHQPTRIGARRDGAHNLRIGIQQPIVRVAIRRDLLLDAVSGMARRARCARTDDMYAVLEGRIGEKRSDIVALVAQGIIGGGDPRGNGSRVDRLPVVGAWNRRRAFHVVPAFQQMRPDTAMRAVRPGALGIARLVVVVAIRAVNICAGPQETSRAAVEVEDVIPQAGNRDGRSGLSDVVPGNGRGEIQTFIEWIADRRIRLPENCTSVIGIAGVLGLVGAVAMANEADLVLIRRRRDRRAAIGRGTADARNIIQV